MTLRQLQEIISEIPEEFYDIPIQGGSKQCDIKDIKFNFYPESTDGNVHYPMSVKIFVSNGIVYLT